MTAKSLNTLLVLLEISPKSLGKLQGVFKSVHYHPTGEVPPSVLPSVDVAFTSSKAFVPAGIQSFSSLTNLIHVQLGSAGADKACSSPPFVELVEADRKDITLSSASGTHVISIPQYVVGTILAVYMKLSKQIMNQRTLQRWAQSEISEPGEPKFFIRNIRGKTVGVLGYGHLGRETARLLQVFGVDIIAANSDGKRKEDHGYVIPGTGDPSASIPSEFYSTSDKASFEAFLSKSDILVASLPSTKETQWLLNSENLTLLPEDATFINVGRGDLVKSEDLLKALNRPGGLSGAVLDVTDPEPLTPGHPLWTHPKVIITPHTSGDTEGELDIATDILIENVERLRAGKQLLNLVDLKKGY